MGAKHSRQRRRIVAIGITTNNTPKATLAWWLFYLQGIYYIAIQNVNAMNEPDNCICHQGAYEKTERWWNLFILGVATLFAAVAIQAIRMITAAVTAAVRMVDWQAFGLWTGGAVAFVFLLIVLAPWMVGLPEYMKEKVWPFMIRHFIRQRMKESENMRRLRELTVEEILELTRDGHHDGEPETPEKFVTVFVKELKTLKATIHDN